MRTCKHCGAKDPAAFRRKKDCNICRECYNGRYRAYRLAAFAEQIETVDVVLPVTPSLHASQAYHLMSALTRRVDAIHDNGAVGIIFEPGAIRLRLFAGEMPSWMTDKSHRWQPLKIADIAPLVEREIDVHGEVHHLSVPTVERLQPCRVLRIVAQHKHNQKRTPQAETVRRRLLAGGVLCQVVRDGEPYLTQTGGAFVQEKNVTTCTPLRVLCATERDGLIAQTRPLGAGGRYGGGFAVRLDGDHGIEIPKTGLRRLRDVVRELGVDQHTIQSHMRALGYDWLHAGHGRYFDEAIMQRLRERIPSLEWRKEAPRTRHYWTDDERAAVWRVITGQASYADAAQAVGRTRQACRLMAVRLRAEPGGGF